MTYLSVKEAAKIAGKTERTIRRWIGSGRVKSTEIKGKYHVDESSLKHNTDKNIHTSSSRTRKDSDRRSTIGERFEQSGIRNGFDQAQQTVSNNLKQSQTDESREKNKKDEHHPIGRGNLDYIKNTPLGEKSDTSLKQMDISDGQTDMSAGQMDKKYVRISKKMLGEIIRKIYSSTISTERKNISNNSIQEGIEYVLNHADGQSNNMSEYRKNNMSVNKSAKNLFGSQVDYSKHVEMSENNNLGMSVSGLSNTDAILETNRKELLSDFDGHLSTDLDIYVDNYFDDRGILDIENLFFDDLSGHRQEMSGHIYGHDYVSGQKSNIKNQLSKIEEDNQKSEKESSMSSQKWKPQGVPLGRGTNAPLSGIQKDFVSDDLVQYFGSQKYDRIAGMSGYAMRLINEKERVANKFEEQNDYLKNELSELRKEISALREVVAGESKNRANLSENLLRMNEQYQKESELLLQKLDESRNENYELRIKNYEEKLKDANGLTASTSFKQSQKDPMQDESENLEDKDEYNGSDLSSQTESDDLMDIRVERLGSGIQKDIDQTISNNLKDSQTNRVSTRTSDLHKMFLVGIGLGMILGVMVVSLVFWLIVYFSNI